jgi:hypothetical protein
VAEFNPALRELENPAMMRRFGLIRENLDGFEQPGVLRSVPHTLGLSQTTRADGGSALGAPRAGGEASATGWSHDGAPGGGSLREFAIGAVIQHAPKTLAHVPGRDFRLPTEAELEALLAFQLSLGRQQELVAPEDQDFWTTGSISAASCSLAPAPRRTKRSPFATTRRATAPAVTVSPGPMIARGSTGNGPPAPTTTRTHQPAAATHPATAAMAPRAW